MPEVEVVRRGQGLEGQAAGRGARLPLSDLRRPLRRPWMLTSGNRELGLASTHLRWTSGRLPR